MSIGFGIVKSYLLTVVKVFNEPFPGHQWCHRRLPGYQVVDVPLPHRGLGHCLLHCHEGNPGEAEHVLWVQMKEVQN